jgi:hypothetical protein
VRYEFQVSDGTRFEDEREQPLAVGDHFTQLDVMYRVDEVLPGHDDFAATYKVTHVGGPVEHGGP